MFSNESRGGGGQQEKGREGGDVEEGRGEMLEYKAKYNLKSKMERYFPLLQVLKEQSNLA